MRDYGTLAMAYDDMAVVLPIAHPEAFDDGSPSHKHKKGLSDEPSHNLCWNE